MKLASLTLSNFRCYKKPTTISFSDLTAIIGGNDAGKSTILEALDVFFNDARSDKNDYSVSGDTTFTITCEFIDLPSDLILDSSFPTNLGNEHLLNERGHLELKKTYSGATPKLKAVHAIAQHPTATGYDNLLELKKTELKTLAEARGIDLTATDKRINAAMRRAIWDSCENLRIAKKEVLLLSEKAGDVKEDAKKVWTKIHTELPAYALFKSDRASTDGDPEAQDPLNDAIKEALKEREAELNEIREHVLREVSKVADATVEKLREMDPNLASQLNPQFADTLKWNSVFKATITGDDDIPFNKRGSGVKRLILLNFFRAKAEQKALKESKGDVIYAVEEPETSQHPNNQRLLIRAFMDLTSNVGCQVILTSHTPMLVRSIPDTLIRYVQPEKGGKRTILVGSEENNELFARALGVIPDNRVKVFVGVEGPNDMNFLRNVSKTLAATNPGIPDLEAMECEGSLIFVPLGGSTLALWCSRLERLNRPEFYIFDRDAQPPSQPHYQAAVDEINARNNAHATSTSKREIENYIHSDAIQQFYNQNGQTVTIPTFADFDDVPHEIAKLLHTANSPKPWDDLDADQIRKKVSKVKSAICDGATKLMTQSMINAIDPGSEMIGWLSKISELISETTALSAK